MHQQCFLSVEFIFCYDYVVQLTGATGSMPVSPLIMGLLGTAGILATGVCLVLAALCRRHYTRPCHRPDNSGTKHVPMEAVIAAEDLIVDGSITGVRTPVTPDQAITADAIRNGNTIEATDPDIIRNQYGIVFSIMLCRIFFLHCVCFCFVERRQMHGFMKVYEPPNNTKDDEEEDGEEYHFRHVAKETHIPNQTVSGWFIVTATSIIFSDIQESFIAFIFFPY